MGYSDAYLLMSHIPLILRIREAFADRVDQSQLLIDFPQQKNSSISRKSPAIECCSDSPSPRP